MSKQVQFVRQTTAVLLACGLMVSLLRGGTQGVIDVPAASGVTCTWHNGKLNLALTNAHYQAAVEIRVDGIVRDNRF